MVKQDHNSREFYSKFPFVSLFVAFQFAQTIASTAEPLDNFTRIKIAHKPAVVLIYLYYPLCWKIFIFYILNSRYQWFVKTFWEARFCKPGFTRLVTPNITCVLDIVTKSPNVEVGF